MHGGMPRHASARHHPALSARISESPSTSYFYHAKAKKFLLFLQPACLPSFLISHLYLLAQKKINKKLKTFACLVVKMRTQASKNMYFLPGRRDLLSLQISTVISALL